MARLNNVPEISDTVTDLSDLMEASIGRDDRLVTVEEEFKYAFKYISILKKIWRKKIVFKEEIIGDADKVEIPCL